MKYFKLQELSKTIESGGRPYGGASTLVEGGIPSLGGEHLNKQGGFNFKNIRYIPESFFNSMRNGHILPDDILLVKDGATTGKVSFVDKNFPFKKAAVNEHLFLIRIDKRKAYPAFVFHFLFSKKGQEEILKDFRGATVGGISRTFAELVQVPLVTLPDQIRIANLLSRIEALAAKRRASLLLLEELVISRFWEMFGNLIQHKDGKKQLNILAKIDSGLTKGKNYKNKETVTVPYLRVANVQAGHIDISQLNLIEALPSDIQKYDLRKGDLLLTEGGDPDKLGRGSLWIHDVPNCIFQNHVFRVRVLDEEVLNPIYLSYLTSSSFGKRYFLKSAKQTTGIASINSTQLGQFPISLPSPALQTRFANFVAKVDSIKEKYTASLTALEHLYSSTSHQAFQGKSDLSAFDVTEELLRYEIEAAKGSPSIQDSIEAVGQAISRLHRQMVDAAKPLVQVVKAQSKTGATMAAFQSALEILQRFQPLQKQSIAQLEALSLNVAAYQKIQKEWAQSVNIWANKSRTFEEFWEEEIAPENYEERKTEMYNWLREGFLVQEFDTEKRSIVFKIKNAQTK